MSEASINFHPIACVFPMIAAGDAADLVEDIKANGLVEPIVLFEGQILDGRNRFIACQKANIEPRFDEFKGDAASALAYVISKNLRRRHLTESQRATVAGKIATLKDGQRKVGKFADVPTTSEAAAMLNVSERSVRSARDVIAKGTPELVRAVEDGKLAVSAAASIIDKPAEVQRAVADDVQSGAKPADAIRRHTMRVMTSSESPEWYSPPHIVEIAAKFLGAIDLDPSWHPDSPVKAANTYTKADDGLSRDWRGKVYLNPPYGREIDGWILKLVAEHEAGNITEAVALLPARTDTEWWSRLNAYPRCFVSGRLTFANSQNAAPFPSAIVYIGSRTDDFADAFGDVGSIFVRHVAAKAIAPATDPHPLDIPAELRRAAP